MVARFGCVESRGDKPKETLKTRATGGRPYGEKEIYKSSFFEVCAWRLGFMRAVCEKGQFSGWRGL